MTAKTVYGRMYFQDEIRRIPCGWRGIKAVIGRKWVRITELHGHPILERRVRVPIKTWRKIEHRFQQN